MAARGHEAGGERVRRRAVHRTRRLRRVPHGLATAGPIALRRGLRAPRRGHAAQRAEGSRSLDHLAAQGRRRAARQGLLRQALRRENDVRRAAHGAQLQRRLGDAARGRAAPAQSRGAGDPARDAPRVGNRDRRPARRRRHQGPQDLHPRARRAAGGDARDPERGLLPAEVHLHLDAGRRSVSHRVTSARAPGSGAA